MLVMRSTVGSFALNSSGASGVTDTPFKATRVSAPALSR